VERRRKAANVLGDIQLHADSLDTLPEQIRAALHKRKVRVIDLFRQLDDDYSGRISVFEFIKALEELGLRAPEKAVAAVFHSFDHDDDGLIEYAELHTLLIRSVQRHPRLEPLDTTATMAVTVRKAPVKKNDSNVLGAELAHVGTDANLSETLPNQIREALHNKLVRVIDLFRQLDDDSSSKISVFEWIKAMREMGLEAPPPAIVAVFNSFDTDKDGYLNYKELDKLLRASKSKHPKLREVKSQPLKNPAKKSKKR